MRTICIVGSGHVGLVTGACLAALGNNVTCTDDDLKKIEALKRGALPFYEPGLEELVRQGMKDHRLSFDADVAQGARGTEIVFICVGTPQRPGGAAFNFSNETQVTVLEPNTAIRRHAPCSNEVTR